MFLKIEILKFYKIGSIGPYEPPQGATSRDKVLGLGEPYPTIPENINRSCGEKLFNFFDKIGPKPLRGVHRNIVNNYFYISGRHEIENKATFQKTACLALGKPLGLADPIKNRLKNENWSCRKKHKKTHNRLLSFFNKHFQIFRVTNHVKT